MRKPCVVELKVPHEQKDVPKNDKSNALIKLIKWLYRKAAYVISFVTGGFAVLAILDYQPVLELNTSLTTNSKDAFSSLFELHNSSKFSIRDVNYVCYAEELGFPVNSKMRWITFDPNYEDIPELRKNESVAEAFPFGDFIRKDSVNLKIEHADVYFFYTYTYLYFFHCHDRFRFVGNIDSEGKTVWTKQRLLLPDDFNPMDKKVHPIFVRSRTKVGQRDPRPNQ